MALICKCGSPVYSLGVPECSIKMAPIVRMLFTTYTDNMATSPASFDLTASNTTYPDLYRLVTPYLVEVSSERAEAVIEEVGATKYYVRQNPRSVSAVVPILPPTFAQFISLLRCQNKLGVFFVDANGVVWGRRQDTATGFAAAPIPVVPSTVNAVFEFPSYSTVKKIRITFELPFLFEDFELIPVAIGDQFIQYQAPLPVGWRILNPTVPGIGAGSWRVRFFDEYLNQAGVSPIGISGATPLANILILDETLTPVTNAVTDLGNGYYQLGAALTTGTRYILDATGVATPALYDWNGVYHRFTAQ